jgi:xanthine dehydrogenase YagT iron-sulfur-binding subunit
MTLASTFRGPNAIDLSLTVNGRTASVHVPPHRSLLDALRESLGLTGTKKVCNEGDCGACTVLVDGRPIYSCITLAIACEGRSVETIEGLGEDGKLHPVQQAFIEKDAYQCGFCTPGQVMSIVALLRADPDAREEDVKRAVAGNLCRCGAYANIVEAGVAAGKSAKRSKAER